MLAYHIEVRDGGRVVAHIDRVPRLHAGAWSSVAYRGRRYQLLHSGRCGARGAVYINLNHPIETREVRA